MTPDEIESILKSHSNWLFRVSEAVVLSVSDGNDFAVSKYGSGFIYRVGEVIKVDDFDEDRWNECSRGIHCFLTRHEAEMWEG